jgi:formate dehydrogenase major subunit
VVEAAATAENNWAFDYLPKLDKQYDMLQVFELMTQGKVNGYIAQGFNPWRLWPTATACAKVSRS